MPQQEINYDLSIIFECWIENEDGTYTAFIGYENRSTIDGEPYEFTIPEGPNNRFIGSVPEGETPITDFNYPNVVEGRPGRTPFVDCRAVATRTFGRIDNWDGERIVWSVTTPDGATRTATITIDNPAQQCPEPCPPPEPRRGRGVSMS